MFAAKTAKFALANCPRKGSTIFFSPLQLTWMPRDTQYLQWIRFRCGFSAGSQYLAAGKESYIYIPMTFYNNVPSKSEGNSEQWISVKMNGNRHWPAKVLRTFMLKYMCWYISILQNRFFKFFWTGKFVWLWKKPAQSMNHVDVSEFCQVKIK